jgi:molybdopterin-guanine dinucleotide biosynthesis protein A
MNGSCTGVILSGGLNSRFSGENKALFNINGMRILDRIFSVFRDLFETVILVTNNPEQYLEYDVHMVTDIFDIRSSLTGIHAGLFYSHTPYAFISACDTPFIKKEMIQTVLEEIEPQTDVIIPETSSGLEPLCAAYSTRCLKPIERCLSLKKLKIQSFFKDVRVKKVREPLLRKKDPDLSSFYNINIPDDMIQAKELMKKP